MGVCWVTFVEAHPASTAKAKKIDIVRLRVSIANLLLRLVGSLLDLCRLLKHGQRLVEIQTNITYFQYCKVLVVLKFLSLGLKGRLLDFGPIQGSLRQESEIRMSKSEN
jgi:hypothetical protein